MTRDAFAHAGLAQIPKILTLQDRNPHSPTYGCFDRNFWHYKTIDFPSGMAQELVWPLALAFETGLPGNRFHQAEALRDWAAAGIAFAARSAHADGSCDDYFPFERAGGAAAFSLLACLETYALLGLEDPPALAFFERRAAWLAGHHESGRLANHQALICLCLALAGRQLGTDRFERALAQRLARVLAWQHDEGWFQEYEGCDPGYHTLTLSLLARLEQLRPDETLRAALAKAIRFAAHFVHPDGSAGGEYASRNTYNFFPHGLELAGRWLPEALAINDRFLVGLAAGRAACHADDHVVGHHAWSYLLAWRDWVASRPAAPAPPTGRAWFPGAGLLVDRRADQTLYVALNKGGVFKLFRGDRLAVSDTQLSLQVGPGRGRNAVGHLVDDYAVRVEPDRISVSGALGWAKQTQMTSLRLLLLRLAMLAGGRWFPDLVRRVLQRALITGKRAAPFRFVRELRFEAGAWVVRDELRAGRWSDVRAAGLGSAQTSIYVAMSRTYQEGQLQPWRDLTDAVRKLPDGEPLVLERRLAP